MAWVGVKFSSAQIFGLFPLMPIKATMDTPQLAADLVQIEFRWKSGGANDQYEINAIVAAKQNLKNFVLIGHFAVAEHYLSSSKWLWQPSVRLLKTEGIFQGEVKSLPLIRCPRKDDGNSMMIFNERAWGVKDSQLLLLRVTAVSDSGTVHFQKAYSSQKIGDVILLDSIDMNDVAYVGEAENPTVTQVVGVLQQKEKWPDFKIWDKRDKFELYEAACLWFNIDPVLPMPEEARLKYQAWKNLIFDAALPVDTDSTLQIVQIGKRINSAITPHTPRVDREVLESLAEEEGHRPLFLYPHKRGEK
jgi:hypothetical protein